MKYIMALDQGTTSSRTFIFGSDGEVKGMAAQGFPCLFPRAGWVEQDAETIWNTQKATMDEALKKAGLKMSDMSAVGITNQRETVLGWHKDTGEPAGPAINWQCRRTADYCEELKRAGHAPNIRNKTGLVTDAYFSATKMRWILQNSAQAKKWLSEGKLLFGTIDSWLVYKLSGGRSHITDVSNASRTLICDIHRQEWDDELLKLFEIPAETLPEIKPSSGLLAVTDDMITGAEVPICGILGDQQSSLFGQACFEPGDAKNTYGTGCFMLANTGENVFLPDSGVLSTVAWRIDDKTTYALEGSVFIGGAVIQWLRDSMGLFSDAAETEKMALSVEDNGGVYFVPAFAGLGTPHWDAYARGLIIGLTRYTTKEHIIRAALESICLQSRDLMTAITKDTGLPLKSLKVDGGASANNFLCQFQADVLGVPVVRPHLVETTVMGAAFIAGLGSGVWQNLNVLKSLFRSGKEYEPSPGKSNERLLKDWSRAVERSKGWVFEND